MSDCLGHQETIDEVAALCGGLSDLPSSVACHLKECPICQEYWDDNLQLNRLLEEPLAMPPADLTQLVMARINTVEAQPVSELRLPWGERFAWAISGAMALYCLERLPEYTSSSLATLSGLWELCESLMKVPVAASAGTLVAAATLLFVIQGALVYGSRKPA